MTIRNASDVNTLLEHALNLPGPSGSVPADDDAREAASRLAYFAHKVLGAGLTPEHVEAAWPELLEPIDRCPITGLAAVGQGPDGPMWEQADPEIHVSVALMEDYPDARAFLEQRYELGEPCPDRPELARHARLRPAGEAVPG